MKLVLAICIVSCLLVFGCASTGGGTQHSGASYPRAVAGAWKATYLPHYNGTDIPLKAQDKPGDFIVTYYSMNSTFRFDQVVGKDNQALRTAPGYDTEENRWYNTSTGVYTCSRKFNSDSFVCHKDDNPLYLSDLYVYFLNEDFIRNPQFYKVQEIESRVIAGAEAKCFKLTGLADGYQRLALIYGNYTLCQSKEGAPLYLQLGLPAVSSREYLATSYSTEVYDTDFSLPAPISTR